MLWERNSLNVFNVATEDNITVTEIARIVIDLMKLKYVKITYIGGNRGWKGDVPVVHTDSSNLAMQKSVESILRYAKEGKFNLDA